MNLLLRDFLITLRRFFLPLKFISLKFFADKDQIRVKVVTTFIFRFQSWPENKESILLFTRKDVDFRASNLMEPDGPILEEKEREKREKYLPRFFLSLDKKKPWWKIHHFSSAIFPPF